MSDDLQIIIKVDNLIKKYGDNIAVDDISFEVEKGSIFAFLGPNGAGKSTTIKILTTLLDPTSGNIIINGFNPVTEQDKVRENFGIVFQDPSLDDDLTSWENLDMHGVLYGMKSSLRKQRVEELLKFVELWDRKSDLVKTFSGGMKRRLEIARGLMHHPKIFFLDEPTLGLDPQTRNHIWTYIQKLNKQENITIFFTTHYMEEADRVAETVAVIDHGKIVSQGSPEQLKKQTETNNLEDAFLKLTGTAIREEAPENMSRFRSFQRARNR